MTEISNNTNNAAVVLCAGTGSRMGLPDNINKCAAAIGNTSAVRYTVSSLLSAGFDSITIVTGHAAGSLRRALGDICDNPAVQFVHNDKYNYHGCNYSIACGVSGIAGKMKRLLIAEGDSLHRLSAIKQVAHSNAGASSLVRSYDYADMRRSVIAIGTDAVITRYHYNMNHDDTMPELKENEKIIGESMQLWSFTGDTINKYQQLLREYKQMADKSGSASGESGIYTINMLGEAFLPVLSATPDDWINLNEQNDLRKAEEVEWLQR